jgi:hypothetical protein
VLDQPRLMLHLHNHALGPNHIAGEGWRNYPRGSARRKPLESSPLVRSLEGPRHRRLVLPQSSSNSRFTAGASGFLNFRQWRERQET